MMMMIIILYLKIGYLKLFQIVAAVQAFIIELLKNFQMGFLELAVSRFAPHADITNQLSHSLKVENIP